MRRLVPVFVMACVVMAVAPMPVPASTTSVVVEDVWPRAGEVVDAGPVRVAARVEGGGAAELRVDGQVVAESAPDTGAEAETQRVVAASVPLAAGDHIGEVRADGKLIRAWRFTASDHRLVRRVADSPTGLAVALARNQVPGGEAAGAVLVRDDDAADAVSGGALAAGLDLPLLLTASDSLPVATREALADLVAPGSEVHVLGGEAAIGPGVAEEVAALGLEVRRHGGVDRYDTAAKVAAALPPSTTAYVASGTSFADALAASPAAARVGAPVLLTAADRLPAASAAALADRGTREVVVVGGTAVISDDVIGELGERGISARRVAGPDRAATSAALAAEVTGAGGGGVAVASSGDPLATLVAARDAASASRPLLLSDHGRLSDAVRLAASATAPGDVVLYGASDAVPEAVGRDLRAAITSGPAGLCHRSPALGASLPDGRVEVLLAASGEVDAARSVVTALVDDRQVPVGMVATDDPAGLAATVDLTSLRTAGGGAAELRLVALVALADGAGWARADWTITVAVPDPVFATTGGVDLHLPSTDVALIGFHQSNHDGAQGLVTSGNGTEMVVMPDRGRDTHPTGAADVVANPNLPITAPVTGTVIRAGTYRLYCDHTDHYLVIEPEQRPGWEVKLLHFTGLSVGVGDRVEAGQTQVGTGPRALPFRSQVDAYDEGRGWPHVHIEVVDPTVPDRPGPGC